MKTVFIFVVILVMTGSVFAQGATPRPLATPPKIGKPIDQTKYSKPTIATCDLTLDKAPEIRGIKLGDELLAAEALLGEDLLSLSADNLGVARAWAKSPMMSRRRELEGIRSLHLEALDGKIYKIEVEYEVDWKSLNEYVDNFSPKLGVPRDAWTGEYVRRDATMRCKDFDIVLTWGYMTSGLNLTNKLATTSIAERRSQAADAKKKEIKP